MKINYSSQRVDARIELLPLIDVIFCILTFFVLAAVALTRQSGINVDLPQAASGVTQMRQMLLVSVDPVGLIYVEKDPVTETDLRQRVMDFREAEPDGMVVLYASRLSSYNDVVRVLDILRSAGGDRVALATLPEAPDRAEESPFLFPTEDPDTFSAPADPLGNDDFNPFPDSNNSLPLTPGSTDLPGVSPEPDGLPDEED